MARVRTLIVDDSATMRSLIAAALRKDPDIEVVGQAGDPLEAREAIKRLNPDVITLDVEMPNMNGLDFLEKIMRLRPTRRDASSFRLIRFSRVRTEQPRASAASFFEQRILSISPPTI